MSPDADLLLRSELKSRASFVELWMSWKRMALALGCYQHVPNTLAEGFSGPGFLRVCRLWRRLEAWTKSNCPNVFDTLSSGADKTTMELTGALVDELLTPGKRTGGWYDSLNRLVFAIHDGQDWQPGCGLNLPRACTTG